MVMVKRLQEKVATRYSDPYVSHVSLLVLMPTEEACDFKTVPQLPLNPTKP